MECFLVAPSEAVLTGLCLEEYLSLKATDPELSFLTLLNARISPFSTNLRRVKWTDIPASEIPEDVSWLPVDGMQVGTSKREANVLYGINESGAYRKQIRHSKDFSMLLTCFLAPYVGMAPWMRKVTEEASDVNWNIASSCGEIFDGILEEDNQDPAIIGIRGLEDKPSEIADALSDLMSYNNLPRFYELGRSFGRLIGGIFLYRTQDSHPLFYIVSIAKSLMELNSVPEVQNSVLAQNVLANIYSVLKEQIELHMPVIQLFGQCFEDGTFYSERISEVLSNPAISDEERERLSRAFDTTELSEQKSISLPAVERLQPAIWVALGTILEALRDLDQDVKNKDSQSVSPRAFICKGDDSPEKLRRNLAFWESALAGGMVDYEKVVPGLSVAIESLTKRLWVKDYQLLSKNRSSGLSGLLKDKFMDSMSESSEKRFASLAFSLYKGYRNEAVHQMDTFEMSLSEARYFVAGIRALLDLYEQIMLRRA